MRAKRLHQAAAAASVSCFTDENGAVTAITTSSPLSSNNNIKHLLQQHDHPLEQQQEQNHGSQHHEKNRQQHQNRPFHCHLAPQTSPLFCHQQPPSRKRKLITALADSPSPHSQPKHAESAPPTMSGLTSADLPPENEGIEDSSGCASQTKLSGDNQRTIPVPSKEVMEGILDKLQKRDTYGAFSKPVDVKEVPDYYDVIKHPMDFGTMRMKISEGMYSSLEQFEKDILLICSNAMHYNSRETVYFKQARSIQAALCKAMEVLKAECAATNGNQKSTAKQGTDGSLIEYATKNFNAVEPSVSGYMSEPTPATSKDHGAPLSTCKGGKSVASDRSSLAAWDTEGQVSSVSCFSGSAKALIHSPGEARAEEQSEFAGSFFKSRMTKDDRGPYNLEVNYRSYFRPCLGQEKRPIVAIGGNQQLLPMGHQLEYACARSLAQFAADLGPSVWKFAAKKIQKALPSGLPFGPGWVGEQKALAGEQLWASNKEKSHIMHLREPKATWPSNIGPISFAVERTKEAIESNCLKNSSSVQSFMSSVLTSNGTISVPRYDCSMVCHLPKDSHSTTTNGGRSSVDLTKLVNHSEFNTGETTNLCLEEPKVVPEVSQSMLLEMVSKHIGLSQVCSSEHAETARSAATKLHICEENHQGGEIGAIGNMDIEKLNIATIPGHALSSTLARPISTKHGSDGECAAVQMLHVASGHDHYSQNCDLTDLGAERRTVQELKVMPVTPVGFPCKGFSVGKDTGTEDSRMQNWVQLQSVNILEAGKNRRAKLQVHPAGNSTKRSVNIPESGDNREISLQTRPFWNNMKNSQLAGTLTYHPNATEHYTQTRLGFQQHDCHAKVVSQEIANLLNLHSCLSTTTNAVYSQTSNQPWQSVPLSYASQQSVPRSSLEQQSKIIIGSHQPDLALQL